MIYPTYTYPGAALLMLRISRARRRVELLRRERDRLTWYEDEASERLYRLAVLDVGSARIHYAELLEKLRLLNLACDRGIIHHA